MGDDAGKENCDLAKSPRTGGTWQENGPTAFWESPPASGSGLAVTAKGQRRQEESLQRGQTDPPSKRPVAFPPP